MNANLTEIIFLLDRSGSMAGLESDTIGGFNGFVEKQGKQEGETLVTAVLFDDRYEVLWNGMDANEVRLTDRQYYVRGTTALLDAVGKTILDVGQRYSRTGKDRRPDKVIFVITTDGMENASREFNYEKVKELIKHQQEKHGWEFIFMGANIDVEKEADSIGISRDSAYAFQADSMGVVEMYDTVHQVVEKKRGR